MHQVDLLSGEQVRWSGVPIKLPVLNQADLLLVPFSIPDRVKCLPRD